MSILSAVVAVFREGGKGFLERMTEKEASLILGAGMRAGAEEISRKYRQTIQRNHPDRGGSRYLAQKINEARELLLKNKIS